MMFNNNEEMNVYTSDLRYAKTPDFRLCFGVNIAKNNIDNVYEYHLRFNISSIDQNDIPETDQDRLNKMSWYYNVYYISIKLLKGKTWIHLNK